MKSPSATAQKWAQRLGQSAQAVKDGVNAVTVSPTERAAARQDAYVQGVQDAVNSGRYANGLRRVTLQDWQRSMIEKGIPRISGGATAAQPKMEAFMNKLLPFIDSGRKALDQRPRGDLQQNIARMVAWAEYMHGFRK